jgi:hypothetical protein
MERSRNGLSLPGGRASRGRCRCPRGRGRRRRPPFLMSCEGVFVDLVEIVGGVEGLEGLGDCALREGTGRDRSRACR